jgi:hypothetical protein
VTFLLRDFHSIFSVDYRKMPVPRRILVCRESFDGGSGGARQMRLDWVCWMEVRLSQPGCSPVPSLIGSMMLLAPAIFESRCSWCCWKPARVNGGDVPSSQRSSTQTLGQSGRAEPQSIWCLTAVAITPLGLNYCLELMNYWLVKHLLEWYFSK